MAEGMPVRCPVCRREQIYAPAAYPCPCGTPVVPPVLRGAAPVPIAHRNWADEWVTVCCPGCRRQSQWPQPELGCECGTSLRIPVKPVASGLRAPAEPPRHIPLPRTGPAPRPAFHPVTIRTAHDAVTAAALYLKWLGYREVRRGGPASAPPSGVGLRAPGLVALVEPTTRPASLRDVECLWLTSLAESSVSAYFSLAGYTPAARSRADALGVPLFVLDLTGTPQPVNSPADELISTGA